MIVKIDAFISCNYTVSHLILIKKKKILIHTNKK